jgi:hypothetical protein
VGGCRRRFERQLGRALEPLFLTGSADDPVPVAEAKTGAGRTMRVPEAGNFLLDLRVFAGERRVMTLGEGVKELRTACGQPFDLEADVVERSHADVNVETTTLIPYFQFPKK